MAATEVETFGHFIAGRWLPARADAVSVNPARPREEVGRHALATPQECTRAVEAAAAALDGWRATPFAQRGAILRRAARLIESERERLGVLLTREEGKTLAEATGEAQKAADAFAYHGAQAWTATGAGFASSFAEEEIRTVRVPVGVVTAITPWNFPLAIPAWKIAPALVYGNPVVWKPASPTPILAAELARLLAAAGIPDGVLNLVFAAGAAGETLVDHPDVAAVTFTGSTTIGQRVWRRATERGAIAQAEMGGHNPAIVFDDADIAAAADHIVAGSMLSTGQKCTATRRVIVQHAVHDELVEAIVARVEALRVGDGLEPGVDVGPLVTARARDDVARELVEGLEEGGEVRCGGGPLEHPDGGFFFAPTVVDAVAPASRLAQEEIFGPVTSVLTAGDDDEAIALANATRYGLSAAAFTRSERRARRVVAEVEAGMIHLNNPTPGSEVHVPFGGVRASSAFAPAEQGLAARDFFTRTKVVFARPG